MGAGRHATSTWTPQESRKHRVVWRVPPGARQGPFSGAEQGCPCLGTGSWESGWAEARLRGQVRLGRHSPGSPGSPTPITTPPTARPASDLILFPVCSSPAGSRRSDVCGLSHLAGGKDTELPLSTPVSTRVLVRDKGEKASPLSVWEGFLEEEALYRGEQDMSLQVHWGRGCKRGCKP